MAALGSPMPPIPPEVRAQQMGPARPPAMQFAESSIPAVSPQQFDSTQFLLGKVNQVAELLTEVAKVLVVDKPALVPLVKKMAQVGGALQEELQASLPQGGAGGNPNQPPTQLQMPEAEGGPAGVSMS